MLVTLAHAAGVRPLRPRVGSMASWDVVPDDERGQWTLEPRVGVGPLRFGMSPDEASAALGATPSMSGGAPPFETASYTRPAVTLYYLSGKGLRGVSVDARRGPQVVAD